MATSYSAGAQIPITRTFVQSGVTTAIPLVGQVLYNGETNWVGVDEGDADYLLTASAANAVETTLADGNTYYYSTGSAPGGYLLITGSQSALSTAASGSNTAASSSATGAMTTATGSSRMTTTHATSSQTASGSAAATTTSSAQRLSGGAIFSLGLAFLAALSVNFLA